MPPEHVQAGRWALTLTHDQATGLYLAIGTEDGHLARVRVLTTELADDAAERLAEEARRTQVYGGTFRWEDLLGEHALQSPPMRPADIQPDEAAEVLWYAGLPGYEPGTFSRLLIGAMFAADSENLAKLGAAFPGYSAAVHMAQHERDGTDQLTRIATGNP